MKSSKYSLILVLNHYGKPAFISIWYIDENRRLVTVPNHKEIAVGTLLSILKQANIEREEFLHYLK
jgi:hypothetical protein